MSQSKDKEKLPMAQLKAAAQEEKGKQMAPPNFALESSAVQAKAGNALENVGSYASSGAALDKATQEDPKQMKAAVDAYQPKKMSMMAESASSPMQAKMAAGGASSPIQMMGRASKEQELPSPESLPGNEDLVREIFNFFYPGMDPGPITSAAEQLAAEMMAAAIRGSAAMDYVPRPPSNPTPTWLFTEAVKMAWRRGGQQGIYRTIQAGVAYGFRGRFDVMRMTGE